MASIGSQRAIVEVKNVRALTVRAVPYEQINTKCRQPEGYDPLRGCYHNDTREIFLNDSLPIALLTFVFFHEVGHFFMENMTEKEYAQIFKATPAKIATVAYQEIAADSFALWMLKGRVPPRHDKFFKKLLVSDGILPTIQKIISEL